jgi:hypothetical protein
MSIEFSPAVFNALSALVVTLDHHRVGAACLAALLLAGGTAMAIARRRKD